MCNSLVPEWPVPLSADNLSISVVSQAASAAATARFALEVCILRMPNCSCNTYTDPDRSAECSAHHSSTFTSELNGFSSVLLFIQQEGQAQPIVMIMVLSLHQKKPFIAALPETIWCPYIT